MKTNVRHTSDRSGEFVTRDLTLSAYLMAKGMRFLEMRKIEKQDNFEFVFTDEEGLGYLLDEWLQKDGVAPVRKFLSCHRFLLRAAREKRFGR